MGRTPCCDKERMKKGAWTPEEDKLLVQHIKEHGLRNWRSLPKSAGLSRCGKSCRLRWANYLRPDIKRGPFSLEEEACIIRLQAMLGNRWASIASHMRGRTDNEIKNFWNTHLKKRLLLSEGKVLLQTSLLSSASTLHAVQWESVRLQAEARLSINSSMRCSSSTGKVYCDMFLKLWNSDVGESFRNMTKLAKKEKPSDSMSDTSSWIKIELNSYTTYEQNLTIISGSEVDSYKPGLAMIVSSHSISSNDFSDSSDAALKLLLDLPTSTGLGLVQDPIDNFTNFQDLQYH